MNELLNVQWTYEDGEKAFSFDLEITRETKDYICAKSNLYGDIYKLWKHLQRLEINGKDVGFVDKWWTE